MDTAPQEAGLPPGLKFLKALVIVLTLTMIVGVITIVALLVTRMPRAMQPASLAMPAEITLPAGVHPLAITKGVGWFAVVTRDDRILIFTPEGKLRQEVVITHAPQVTP